MPRSFYREHGKRALDLAVSFLALALLWPVLALIAIAIKWDSRGPVFYRQERIGRGGRPFALWKFRSMGVGMDHHGAGALVERNDARITRVGAVIRKLSLDEIPQLFNVVSGDMSIVGPRPGLRYQAEAYDEVQRRRLLVLPGATGWAQVNGRNSIEWPRRIELDLEYIERMSLLLDLRVMLMTIPSVLKGGDMIAGRDYWKEKAKEREAAQRGE